MTRLDSNRARAQVAAKLGVCVMLLLAVRACDSPLRMQITQPSLPACLVPAGQLGRCAQCADLGQSLQDHGT